MIKKIILAIVMIFLLLDIVNALGVIPGRTTLYYEPGLEKSVSIEILNTKQKEFDVAIYISSNLKEFIEIPTQNIHFNADEKSKKIDYTVRLPLTDELLEPGINKAEIVIREIAAPGTGEIQIGSLVAVASQLHVHVPIPGKYVRSSLDIVTDEVDKPVQFYIPVHNLGSENINNIKAKIEIFDLYDNKVTEIVSNEISLEKKSRKELSATWQNNVNPGTYYANATINYDGEITKVQNTFVVGKFFLIPLDISVKNFRLGNIAKFNILIQNIGNREIEAAFARMQLSDKQGITVFDTQSPVENFAPQEINDLNTFWDTENVEADTYFGKLTLAYENVSSERQLKTLVTEDSIETTIVGVTGFVTAASPPSDYTKVMTILAIVLIITNVAVVIYFKRKKRR